MTTLRQIAANQRNAQKSTGPATAEGKDASRRNAVKHGLAGDGVVLPDEHAEAVDARMASWRDAYQPGNDQDEWLFRQAVVNSVRVDHCQRLESEVRTQEARRALLCWDDDRRLDAEETAASLARRPALTARRLRQTRQGCEWLIERWLALGEVYRAQGAWTESQQSLAFDLLGTPPDLRDAPPPDAPEALVEREVSDLESLCSEALDDLDASAREAASVGLELSPSRALTRLRRYEASCYRRFHDARRRLHSRPSPSPSESPTTPARPSPSQAHSQPTPSSTSPSYSAPLTQDPQFTDADWQAYEAQIFREILARQAAAPALPPVTPAATPAVVSPDLTL